MRRAVVLPLLALCAASVVALAGCAAGDTARATDGRIQIVASTSVYGQIAEEIGGDAVEVTSVIRSASQDPHSFEASARDQLAVKHADLLIRNGGGYDDFMDALIEASGSAAPVVTAVEFSAEWSGGTEGFNEHVWYDFATMAALAQGIEARLEALDPEGAAAFTANLDGLLDRISGLEAAVAGTKADHAGEHVFVTEPVPLYLATAAGLENVTPDAFTHAVEEGQDVAPATLFEALSLMRSGRVRLVIANDQTGGAETMLVIHEAQTQSIPVLEFSETLPKGQTYVEWMQSNIDAMREGLAK